MERMKAALAACKANGDRMNAPGMKGQKCACHAMHKVPRQSFFDARRWQIDNNRTRDGFRNRDKGKATALADDMEEELLH